jgi:hypothetical protein
MINERSFYETKEGRNLRLVNLIHSVTKSDPSWVSRFVPFLRNEMQMRSAAIVLAAEYVKAGTNGRDIVNNAMSRADEPAEMLAYWMQHYGRSIPAAIKRGVADATVRLVNEYSAMKYDGSGNTFRIGDVINLVHPKPKGQAQADLFKYLLDRRYNGAAAVIPASLTQIRLRNKVMAGLNGGEREMVLANPNNLKAAGLTWENVAGTGNMDAKAWESIIPSMGYMALLRNLRNFDEAGISKNVQAHVAAKLTDPLEVAKSRQFPYRFFSAFKATGNVFWYPVLETALDLSVSNVPKFDGNTLTLVDTSASMSQPVNPRSNVALWEIGALFGAVAAKRSGGTLVSFGDRSGIIPVNAGDSILTIVQRIRQGQYGHGTAIHSALAKHYTAESRALIFTDMQTFDSAGHIGQGFGWTRERVTFDESRVPSIYSFDLAGYGRAAFDTSRPGRHQLAGFTDKMFAIVPLLERAEKAEWPF